MDEALSIFTSVLAYELDAGGLSTRYRLLVSPKVLKVDYPKFYQELRKLDVISMIKSKGRYAVLVSSDFDVAKIQTEDYWQIVPFTNRKDYEIYDNQVLCLLINRLPDDAVNNVMVYHVMSLEDWQKKNGQRYGLKFFVNFESNLSISVVTFSPVKQLEKQRIYYYWDQQHQRMQRSLNASSEQLYEWRNRSSAKNTINFLNTKDLQKFEQSKVGLANRLLENLRNNDAELFVKVPRFRPFKLRSYSQRGDNGISGILWCAIKGATINVYHQSNSEVAEKIAVALVKLLNSNPEIKQNQIKVVHSTAQVSGLNIQVIFDMRGKSGEDLYEVSHDDTIIQHVTVENFGESKIGQDTNKVSSKWLEQVPEELDKYINGTVVKDHKIDKLSQELVIRRDIFERHITSISERLFEQVKADTFYTFSRDKHTGKVEATRLAFFGQQQFQIESQIITDQNKGDQDFWDVYQQLLFSYGGNEKFALSQLVGVIRKGTQLIIIHNTEWRTMPDGGWLQQQLQNSDPRRSINRLALLENLGLQENLGPNEGVRTKLKKMVRQIECIPKVNVTLGEVQRALKKAGISWRGSSMREINDHIASDKELNVAFIPDIFLKSKEQYIQGLYGIGLIEHQFKRDSVLYFVGLQQAMKKQLGKATRLKELRLINIEREDFIANEFKEFEQMLTVKFVNNGQYTVIPFPFKYLNEYTDLKKKMQKFNVSFDF